MYDQFLGTQEHGGVSSDPNDTHPDRLKRSSVGGNDLVLTAFDAAGNLTDLLVKRPGSCTGGVCNQRFVYEWDEVGQLRRARRWDYASVTASTPLPPSPPTGTPAFELTYAYARAARVLKTSQAGGNAPFHTLEVFPSLRVERTTYDEPGGDYVRTAAVETGYLAGAGKVYYGGANLPGAVQGRARVALFVGDRLGSTSVLLDKRTSEVMEKIVVDANGNTESDYRPARWNGTREPYRFTGKEEDVEVGLTYFGARYLSSNLRRWLSPDPLTIHGAAADTNPYAYVGGRTLAAVDPWGLEQVDPITGVRHMNETVIVGTVERAEPSTAAQPPPQPLPFPVAPPPPPPPPPPPTDDVVGAVVEYATHGIAHLPGGFTYTAGDAPRHLVNSVTEMAVHGSLSMLHGSGMEAIPGLARVAQAEHALVSRFLAAAHVAVPDRGGKDITKGVVTVQAVLGTVAISAAAGAGAVLAEGGAAVAEGEAAAAGAARGGAGVVRVGQAGEAAVRSVEDIGEKVLIRVGGRDRIPDGLTRTVLSEVKNVSSLSYTQQLRDFATYASQNGLRFDLWVRPTTRLSGPLAQEVANETINLRYIP